MLGQNKSKYHVINHIVFCLRMCTNSAKKGQDKEKQAYRTSTGHQLNYIDQTGRCTNIPLRDYCSSLKGVPFEPSFKALCAMRLCFSFHGTALLF